MTNQQIHTRTEQHYLKKGKYSPRKSEERKRQLQQINREKQQRDKLIYLEASKIPRVYAAVVNMLIVVIK